MCACGSWRGRDEWLGLERHLSSPTADQIDERPHVQPASFDRREHAGQSFERCGREVSAFRSVVKKDDGARTERSVDPCG